MKNINHDFEFPIPKMEIQLKPVNLANVMTVRQLMLEMKKQASELFVSVNFIDGAPVNYCVCAIGNQSQFDTCVACNNALKAALLSNATSVIFYHNHPYGKALPSKNDLEALCYMSHIFSILDIEVEDLLIVGDDGVTPCSRDYAEYMDPKLENWERMLPQQKKDVPLGDV